MQRGPQPGRLQVENCAGSTVGAEADPAITQVKRGRGKGPLCMVEDESAEGADNLRHGLLYAITPLGQPGPSIGLAGPG